MQSKMTSKVPNSCKHIEIKYPESCKLFFGCLDGSVKEFSMLSRTIVYDFGQILNYHIHSMAKTHDNKI